jgi:hypothetical protein
MISFRVMIVVLRLFRQRSMEWLTRPNESLTAAATESVEPVRHAMVPMETDGHEYAQEWQSDRLEVDRDSTVPDQQRISLRSVDFLFKSLETFSKEQKERDDENLVQQLPL